MKCLPTEGSLFGTIGLKRPICTSSRINLVENLCVHPPTCRSAEPWALSTLNLDSGSASASLLCPPHSKEGPETASFQQNFYYYRKDTGHVSVDVQ